MIWIRRAIAILLAFFFIMMFIPMLFVYRVNDTLGNPKFYTQQLRQANVYSSIYDDLLPALIEEISDQNNNPQIDISVIKTYLAQIVEQTFPPKWIQAQTEQAAYGMVPYLMGDKDNFKIQISLNDRVKAGGQAINSVLSQDRAFSALSGQFVSMVLDNRTPNVNHLPLNEAQITQMLEIVVQPRIPVILESLIPYLSGEQEHFTIHVNIADRIEDLRLVINDSLKDSAFYDYVLSNALSPTLQEYMDYLPSGIAFTDSEIAEAAGQIFPLEWYQSQVPALTTSLLSYLKGTSPTLDLSINLSDRKPAIFKSIVDLLNGRSGTSINSSYLVPLNEVVFRSIPDHWSLTQTLFGDSLSQDILLAARKLVGQGMTYSDSDLENEMGSNFAQLQKIKQKISSGVVFTQQDFYDMLKDNGSANGDAQIRNFENTRHFLGTIRRWMAFIWLVPLLLLVGIGALAARRWPYKLMWGTGVLSIGCLLAYILYGPVFSSLAQPQIDKAIESARSQATYWQAPMVEKLAILTQNAIHSFMGTLRLQTLIFLGLSALIIILAIVWQSRKRKKGLSV